MCLSLCPQSKFRHCWLAIAIYSDSDHDPNPNPNPNPDPDPNAYPNPDPDPNPNPAPNPNPNPNPKPNPKSNFHTNLNPNPYPNPNPNPILFLPIVNCQFPIVDCHGDPVKMGLHLILNVAYVLHHFQLYFANCKQRTSHNIHSSRT